MSHFHAKKECESLNSLQELRATHVLSPTLRPKRSALSISLSVLRNPTPQPRIDLCLQLFHTLIFSEATSHTWTQGCVYVERISTGCLDSKF